MNDWMRELIVSWWFLNVDKGGNICKKNKKLYSDQIKYLKVWTKLVILWPVRDLRITRRRQRSRLYKLFRSLEEKKSDSRTVVF